MAKRTKTKARKATNAPKRNSKGQFVKRGRK